MVWETIDTNRWNNKIDWSFMTGNKVGNVHIGNDIDHPYWRHIESEHPEEYLNDNNMDSTFTKII